jgi:hypothetical protein
MKIGVCMYVCIVCPVAVFVQALERLVLPVLMCALLCFTFVSYQVTYIYVIMFYIYALLSYINLCNFYIFASLSYIHLCNYILHICLTKLHKFM